LRSDPEPDTDYLFDNINPDDNPDEWTNAIIQEGKLFSAWEAAGSTEWKTARDEWNIIHDQYYKERAEVFKRAEKRQFDELGGDLQLILSNGIQQTKDLIYYKYKYYKEREQESFSFSAIDIVALGGNRWKLDAAQIKKHIIEELHLHFNALKHDVNLTNNLNDYIIDIIAQSPYIAKEGTKGRGETVIVAERSKRLKSEIIQALNSIIPQKHIKPNNKLSNEITKDFINEGEISLNVSRRGSKREINTKAMLSYEDKNISLSGRTAFTPYDREVHDGVVTLYEAGNEIVTPEMVYRAMNGMTETEYISPQAIGAVTKSLDKSRRTTLTIDFTEEARAYKKNVKATYEGYLLACDKITVKTGGQVKEAYKLLRKPILYEYSQVSGQIINVPIKLLQTKEAVRSTDEVIVLRGYLLRQIEYMKSPKSERSNNIAFDGIYEELDINENNYNATEYKKKTYIIRQHVAALLSEWVRHNYIKNYCEYKEGKSIKGITINL